MKKYILIITLISLTFSACFFDHIKGSGNIVSEERVVPVFNEISIKGAGTIILTQGDSQSLKIETDDNILPAITTEVSRDKLIISTQGSILNFTSLVYEITLPVIYGIEVSGSAKVHGNEKINAEDIDLKISGSGEIILLLSAVEVNTNITGSGKIKLNGAAEEIRIKISGSGDCDAKEFSCEDARVKVTGSGNCKINATENLDVSVSGSGDVYYYSNPDISTSISGSGTVQKRNL